MTTAVSVRGLKVAYAKNTILADLDIDVREGEFLVLLGPSGCGKSTLLNAIAGLQDIDDGEIWIGGRNVTWAEPKDRGIGMVFQSYALYPRMTVTQNLSFGLWLAGLGKAEIAERVERAAAILQLTPLLERYPAALSGGQRQRVAIGRALVRDVDVFLFDEPLSNLDAKLRTELRAELKRLHLKLANTMIYVTHDQIEALTLADRIAVLKDGVIQQLAPPIEVYDRPANRFVASFLGSPEMNFIEGEVRQTDGQLYFVAGDLIVPMADYRTNSEGLPHGPAELGARPEHLTLSLDGQGAPGRVQLVEQMGAESIVWLETEIGVLRARAPADAPFGAGDELRVSIDAQRVSLFHTQTGLRL